MNVTYNRYIPQPDGSYRRSRVQSDPLQQPTPPQRDPPPEPPSTQKPEPVRQESYIKAAACPRTRQRINRTNVNKQEVPPAGSFLKNLLPKDFDTSDLIIVLLLLLMAGDNSEDQNNALLTLALYFFM